MQKSALFSSAQDELLEKVKDQFPQVLNSECRHQWKIYTFDEDSGIGVWRCRRCPAEKERKAKFLCMADGGAIE